MKEFIQANSELVAQQLENLEGVLPAQNLHKEVIVHIAEVLATNGKVKRSGSSC